VVTGDLGWVGCHGGMTLFAIGDNMRYSCIARGEQCLVEVELSSDCIRVMIYSVEPEKAILYPYNATIDALLVLPDPDVFAEYVARDAIAAYEEEDEATDHFGKHREGFSGELTRLP